MFGFGWGNHFDSAVAHWEVCCSYKKESDDYTSKSGGVGVAQWVSLERLDRPFSWTNSLLLFLCA